MFAAGAGKRPGIRDLGKRSRQTLPALGVQDAGVHASLNGLGRFVVIGLEAHGSKPNPPTGIRICLWSLFTLMPRRAGRLNLHDALPVNLRHGASGLSLAPGLSLSCGFGLGKKANSFARAERLAYAKNDSDLLVGRVRVRMFEGLQIPGLWLTWLGIENANDLPIFGHEVYTVAGTGVTLKEWRHSE